MNNLLNLNYLILIIILISIILYFYRYFKYNITNILTDKQKAEILIRQSARYAHAARQDKDILIALLHANYGSGYLFAAKDIFPESVLISLFSSYKEYKEFELGIITIQDEVNRRTVNTCPDIVSVRDIITKMGGEG
jgi:hypothetical protein